MDFVADFGDFLRKLVLRIASIYKAKSKVSKTVYLVPSISLIAAIHVLAARLLNHRLESLATGFSKIYTCFCSGFFYVFRVVTNC